jgi:hypothetical protein
MRMMQLSSVVLTLAFGCGPDASGGGAATTDKKLSDLSAAEWADFCAANGESFKAIAAGSCTLLGLDAPTKTECESARDDCSGASSGTVCDSTASTDLSACTTVGRAKAESCIRQVKTFFAALTCDAAGKAPPAAPACLVDIEEGCPALTGGT